MHYKQVKGILSARNGMNLYRGCTHGCIYCDSRSKCYQINHDFIDIEIKENALELLETTLKGKRNKCMLSTGGMTDPYIPLENKLHHVQQALKLALKYGFGFALQTKSATVLNDLALLQAINQKTKCVVQMTLTTADERLCKILEPHVSSTKERFLALKKLHEAGIPTVVWLCPILPFINDTAENILAILDMCIEAKVYGIICFNMGMTLREGNREYYYQQLDLHFPGLKEKYQHIYGNSYEVTSLNNAYLMKLFYDKCHKNNIICDNNELFTYLSTFKQKKEFEQLSIFTK